MVHESLFNFCFVFSEALYSVKWSFSRVITSTESSVLLAILDYQEHAADMPQMGHAIHNRGRLFEGRLA